MKMNMNVAVGLILISKMPSNPRNWVTLMICFKEGK